jgi:hypothetical protein
VSDHEEILRLRDRMHSATTRLAALELNQQALLDWRKEVSAIVDELRESDRIAEAVAKRLKEQNTLTFTKWQARIAAAAVLVTAIVGTTDILGHLGVLN